MPIELGKSKIKLKQIEFTEEPAAEIAGHATKKHVLRFAYDIQMEIDATEDATKRIPAAS